MPACRLQSRSLDSMGDESDFISDVFAGVIPSEPDRQRFVGLAVSNYSDTVLKFHQSHFRLQLQCFKTLMSPTFNRNSRHPQAFPSVHPCSDKRDNWKAEDFLFSLLIIKSASSSIARDRPEPDWAFGNWNVRQRIRSSVPKEGWKIFFFARSLLPSWSIGHRRDAFLAAAAGLSSDDR